MSATWKYVASDQMGIARQPRPPDPIPMATTIGVLDALCGSELPPPLRTGRPRDEECEELRAAIVKRCIPSGAKTYTHTDGSRITVLRRPVGGANATRSGESAYFLCPRCGASCVLLRKPPGGAFGCQRCTPTINASQRRPGRKRGDRQPGKPRRWWKRC